jgi:hypothetical protein
MLLLENIEPAKKIQAPNNFRPSVEFDGAEGSATTPGYKETPESFDDFLRDAGLDPEQVEIIPPIKTSKWQQRDGGDWLTSYKFTLRAKNSVIDLPALFAEAKKSKPSKPKEVKRREKALLVCPSDFQVGKTGSRGGTKELIERVMKSYDIIEDKAKKGKYEKIVIIDLGDIIESVSNKANYAQLESNDLSPMQQTDVAASLMFDLIKRMHKYAPVTYGSIASNHCQNRFQGQAVGKPGLDDWGIVILQQLHRLTTELGWDVEYLKPHPEDEGFAFEYGVHVVGCIHGHQSNRPEGIPKWWANASFGNQFAAHASLLLTGHYHFLQVTELGQHQNGSSRFWVQMPTSDAGSDWFRRMAGTDSSTGIGIIELDKNIPFKGTVEKV